MRHDPGTVADVDAELVELPALEPMDGPRRRSGSGRPAVGALAAFVLAIAAISVVILVTRHPADDRAKVDQAPAPTDRGTAVDPAPDPNGDPAAGALVTAALARTTGSGSFHLSYHLTSTPPSAPPITVCRTAAPPGVTVSGASGSGSGSGIVGQVPAPSGAPAGTPAQVCSTAGYEAVATSGEGTVTVAPKSMLVSASVGGGLDVSLRLVGDQVWETGGAAYGQPPSGAPGSGPGQPLSGFADLVESTIGPRAGALGMTRMASPNAYLALEEGSITGATPAGTGTADGAPVTNYDVTVDLSQLLAAPGLTDDERRTIQDALHVLAGERYTTTTVRVSIGDDGYIHQLASVAHFEDGGTVSFDATYSDFGTPAAVAAPPTSAASVPPTSATGIAVAPTTRPASASTPAPTSAAPTSAAAQVPPTR